MRNADPGTERTSRNGWQRTRWMTATFFLLAAVLLSTLPPAPLQAQTEPQAIAPDTETAAAKGKIAFRSCKVVDDGRSISVRFDTCEIYTMNTDGSKQKRLTKNNEIDQDPQWSPDGKRIAFTSNRDGLEIYVMNADGSKQKRLTRKGGFHPEWSPDGKRIAFTSNRDGNTDIYVMNADGSKQKRLTRKGGWYPEWSPDGKYIMFEYGYRDNNEIYVMNADGKNRKRLTRNKVYDGEAQWSPDGKRIAFVYYLDGDHEIYVMNADGSKQKRLTRKGGWYPKWSPDGKRIVFMSSRDGDYEIYVMNADGSKQKRLTKNRSVDAPVWSPDGKRIAFMSWREGYPEIYAMNSNGSNQKRLTKNKTYKYAPVWQPTPQKAPRLSTFARRVVEITNQKRVKNGCPKLTLDSRLTAAAQRHSDDMAAHDFIEHTGSDGSNPGDRISDAGYEDNWWAENIVGASRTPKEAVDAWMGSKPHRKNILNCELTEIGVGYSKNTDTSAKHFWVQVLAQPKNSTQSIVPDGSDTVELEAEPEAQEPLFLPHVLR